MNYAMPLYLCKKDERPGRSSSYSCTVEIGGIRYIGASARTKKEAEIKAARTALLAIQTSTSHSSEKQFGHSKFTVMPCRKRGAETVAKAEGTSKVPKSKKTRFKRRKPRWKPYGNKKGRNVGANNNHEVEPHAKINNESCVLAMEPGPLAAGAIKNVEDVMSVDYPNEKVMFAGEASLSLNSSKIFENRESTVLQSNESCVRTMESSDDGMLVDYPNDRGTLAGDVSLSLNSDKIFENTMSTELQSNEPCVQTMESIPLAAEAMKNSANGMLCDCYQDKGTLVGESSLSFNSDAVFENGMSTKLKSTESCVQTTTSLPAGAIKIVDEEMPVDFQNEKGLLSEEVYLPLNGGEIVENRMSTELQINESCVQTMDSRPVAAESMMNFDNGMSRNYQREKDTLVGESSLSLINSEVFENGRSTKLQSTQSCIQTMESAPFPAESMKNLDDGMPVDYQNGKGILAGEGSLSLNSGEIFENRMSTELQSNESCVQTMEPRTLAVEAIKNSNTGLSVDYPIEKGTVAGEGSLSQSSGKSFEIGKSTESQLHHSCVQTVESRPVDTEVMKNPDDRMSADYQNGKGSPAREGALSLNSCQAFENRKSTECLCNEPCVETVESRPLTVEAIKNSDNGISVDYQSEKGEFSVGSSLSRDTGKILENGNSTELHSNGRNLGEC